MVDDKPMMARAPWPIGHPAVVCLALVLLGAAIHSALWQISEPAILFSDFFKAYYMAGETVLTDEVASLYREGAEVTFVNMPILAFLFAPLARLDDVDAGWIFLALGFTAALASWALLLFLVAAAGGAFLNLNYHWKMLPLPKGIIVGHAGAAVVGFVLLLMATWTATRP